MTREEAIVQLKFMEESMPKEPPTECDYITEWLDTDKDIKNAFHMAIKALEQEPCEDCVNRYDAIRIVQHNNPSKSIEKLRNLPSVTPQEPKTKGSYHPIISGNAQNPPKVKSAEIDNTIIHAKWIERDTDEDWWIECSNCGCSQSYYDDTNYCPHCGARMDKEKEI